MPPKQATGARSRPVAADSSDASSDPFESADDSPPRRQPTAAAANSSNATDGAAAEKSIPKDLLTRILHDLFEKDATRVSRDANAAVGKYVDVFVREAIARTAVEKRSGFLEVCAFLL